MTDAEVGASQTIGYCYDCEQRVDAEYIAEENECPECGGDWFGTYELVTAQEGQSDEL